MTTLTDTPIMNTKNSEQSVVISIKTKKKTKQKVIITDMHAIF